MKNFIKAMIVLSFAFGIVSAQQKSSQIEQIEKLFNQFEYENVIEKAQQILDSGDSLDTGRMIELLRMKGTAHYILDQEDMAALSFVRILKIDQKYEPDPVINSPKLISFFKKVRKNFRQAPIEKKPEARQTKTDIKPAASPVKTSLWRSVLVPGWGHLYAGQKGKGALLISASIVTMTASAYLIIETSNLESEYLNKTVQAEIDKSYKKYNQYYHLRNGFLAAYALVWIYTQLDLPSSIEIDTRQTISFHPALVRDKNCIPVFGLEYSF
jgi:hypothetical protein